MVKSLSLDEALKRCANHFNKVGAYKFLHSPQKEDKYFRELFIITMFGYGLRVITTREWFINEDKQDPPDFELIAFSDRGLADRPIDYVVGELVEIPAILENIDSEEKIIKIEQIIHKKDIKCYNFGTVLLVFVNVPIFKVLYEKVIERIRETGKKFKNIWMIRIVKIDTNSFVCEIKEVKPESSNELVINLAKEFGRGIVFKHKYIDKFKGK